MDALRCQRSLSLVPLLEISRLLKQEQGYSQSIVDDCLAGIWLQHLLPRVAREAIVCGVNIFGILARVYSVGLWKLESRIHDCVETTHHFWVVDSWNGSACAIGSGSSLDRVVDSPLPR